MKISKNAPKSAPKSVAANWTSLPESAREYWCLRDRAIGAMSDLLMRSDVVLGKRSWYVPPSSKPKARKGGRR